MANDPVLVELTEAVEKLVGCIERTGSRSGVMFAQSAMIPDDVMASVGFALRAAQESIRQGSTQPVMECPNCGAEYDDFDGFGVTYCEACGYCQHTAADGAPPVCVMCGKTQMEDGTWQLKSSDQATT